MEDDKIERAERLYRAGNYREARALAREIETLEQADDNDKERAKRILTATGSDPMVAVAFLITACLIVFLIVRYVL